MTLTLSMGLLVWGILVLSNPSTACAQPYEVGWDADFLMDEGASAQAGYVTPQGFVDADAFLNDQDGWFESSYGWHVLPVGLIFKTYLANVKEPRMAARVLEIPNDSTFFEANVGSRVGLLRYGTDDVIRPIGFQIDAEGAAQLRLDILEKVDVQSADYRGGIVVTWGNHCRQSKLSYYHLSSHLADEFLIKNPTFDRLNFARDVILVGHSIYLTDWLRIYGEAGWAFFTDVSQEWEFQFGFDYAPQSPTGRCGTPFVAGNVHLREEVDFGGNFSIQTGWAWRGAKSSSLFRIGFHYYNGKSSQYSFFDNFEQQLGFGIWYDH